MGKTLLMTNRLFAEKDKVFKQACKLTIVARTKGGAPISLAPTARQASKFRNKKGLAYLKRREAITASFKETEDGKA